MASDLPISGEAVEAVAQDIELQSMGFLGHDSSRRYARIAIQAFLAAEGFEVEKMEKADQIHGWKRPIPERRLVSPWKPEKVA